MDTCKLVAKIFYILSIIAAVIGFFAFVGLGVAAMIIPQNSQMLNEILADFQKSDPSITMDVVKTTLQIGGIAMLVGAAVMIIAIIISGVTLKKLKTATGHNELLALGILSIIFVNVIPGVLTIIATSMAE